MIPEGRQRLAIPPVIAGLLELGCHVHGDGQRAEAFHKLLTRPDAVYASAEYGKLRLQLPEGEDVRGILGLASPQLVDEPAEDELVVALAAVVKSCAAFHQIIRRHYYSEEL